MKTVIHTAPSRGYADHGWLRTHHTFSFARYYDPTRIHFGALRVLNDDTVQGGEGFGTHPHDNMEIVSIPLEGELRHGDSMANSEVLRTGEVQVMSAGTGITHSEYNNLDDRHVKFLQIWVFPDRQGLTPRYETLKLPPRHPGKLVTFVTPENAREKGASWIHQLSWFHLLDLDAAHKTLDYQIRRPGNGLYVFVIEGDVTVEGHELTPRDGIGVWDTSDIHIEAAGKNKAATKTELLLIEVPM